MPSRANPAPRLLTETKGNTMKYRNVISQFCLIGATAVAFASSTGHAQNLAAMNASFDSQFNARLAALQQQNVASQQQLQQQYLRTYGPWLQQQYAQHRAQGGNLSFEQFAY